VILAKASGEGDKKVANPLAADLDHVLAHTRPLWPELTGRKIFITGGTGFFGCWLLESLLWANDRLDLGVQATVLSRDPAAFARKAPHLAKHPAVQMIQGDVRSCPLPPGPYPLIIHAAADSTTPLVNQEPLRVLDTIVEGTRRMLDFARQCGTGRFLLTSSGAVYGPQDPHVSHVEEDCRNGPAANSPASVYAEGKRLAELLCAIYTGQTLECIIARGFAFIGPYLPLDIHYAAGNFIRDALAGGPIRITGDGRPVRSYLYGADLAIWLWTILLRGRGGRAYNVGSERAISILELARAVAEAAGGLEVTVGQQARSQGPPPRYVPSTRRGRLELELQETLDVKESILKTLKWYRKENDGHP
jgi:dTDP-glucose 4,6-dehydratase